MELKKTPLENIVNTKLSYALNKKTPQDSLFKDLYNPVEKAVIKKILQIFTGNQIKASKVLGMNRNTLKNRIVKYEIDINQIINSPAFAPRKAEEIFIGATFSLNLFKAISIKLNFMNELKRSDQILDSFPETLLKSVEKTIISRALDFYGKNQMKASQVLGINRNTLKKKIDFHGIKLKSKVKNG